MARAEHLALDMAPHDDGEHMDLQVLWKGKPAPERTVHIRGPKGFQANSKTNETGKVRFKVAATGTYTCRTSVEEPVAGREGDRTYSLIRHTMPPW